MLHLVRKPMSEEMKAQCIANGMTPTCAVDIKGNLYYADEFINSISQDEIKGVVAHEVIHLAFIHLARLGQRDMQIWNICADIVANDMLLSDGFILPKGCILPDNDHSIKFANITIKDIDKKTAEIIYNEIPRQKKGSNNGNEKGKGQKDVYGFDSHIFGEVDEKGNTKQLSQAELDRISKDWTKRLTEATTWARQRGILPCGMERRLAELLNNKVNWKDKLYKYITNQLPYDYSYARKSKRSISSGVYLPSTLKENLLITIAVDCSGSVGDKEYSEFISEMIGISKSFNNVVMNCLFWDTAVNNDLIMKNGNIKLIQDAKINGYGGTTFQCVTDYLKEQRKKPNILIVFSDGFVEEKYEKPSCKTIWVISKNGSVKIPESNNEVIIKLEE